MSAANSPVAACLRIARRRGDTASGIWRETLDALAELGRAVLAERDVQKTRRDPAILADGGSRRADSTSAVKPKRRKVITK